MNKCTLCKKRIMPWHGGFVDTHKNLGGPTEDDPLYVGTAHNMCHEIFCEGVNAGAVTAMESAEDVARKLYHEYKAGRIPDPVFSDDKRKPTVH